MDFCNVLCKWTVAFFLISVGIVIVNERHGAPLDYADRLHGKRSCAMCDLYRFRHRNDPFFKRREGERFVFNYIKHLSDELNKLNVATNEVTNGKNQK